MEKLRTDLLCAGQPCAFTTVLFPSVDVALHDHMYCKPLQEETNEVIISHAQVRDPCPYSSEELQYLCNQVKEKLSSSNEERMKIELATQQQSNCSLWYEARYKRITGSKCSQILKQPSRTPALLRNVLYAPQLNPIPVPMKWGLDKEGVARLKYSEFMKAEGHDVTVEQRGFFIHPDEPWLGASPDAIVKDHCCSPSDGLLEIKCPYSTFFCMIDDSGSVKLKRSHHYYHQVQLQLFVCSNKYHWCDFCVYTPMGVTVEKITLDKEWIEESISKLEDYYDNVILPELVYPCINQHTFYNFNINNIYYNIFLMAGNNKMKNN